MYIIKYCSCLFKKIVLYVCVSVCLKIYLYFHKIFWKSALSDTCRHRQWAPRQADWERQKKHTVLIFSMLLGKVLFYLEDGVAANSVHCTGFIGCLEFWMLCHFSFFVLLCCPSLSLNLCVLHCWASFTLNANLGKI